MTSNPLRAGQAVYLDTTGQVAHDLLPGSTTTFPGAVQLDGTAADIQPTGSAAAAGATGLVPDAAHVHPDSGAFIAADGALLAWAFDPAIANAATALPTSGQIVLTRINLRSAVPVTNVLYDINVVGNTLTSSECFAGLYNSSGTLIGTSADQSTAWAATTGLYTTPLVSGPFTAGPGFVWVAWLFNGTTGPQITRGPNVSVAASNIGFGTAGSRFAHVTTASQTSLAGFTPGSGLTQNQVGYWAGLS